MALFGAVTSGTVSAGTRSVALDFASLADIARIRDPVVPRASVFHPGMACRRTAVYLGWLDECEVPTCTSVAD